MTNDAERVSDIVARLNACASSLSSLVTIPVVQGAVYRLHEAADIIEAQSKALAEARATGGKIVKFIRDQQGSSLTNHGWLIYRDDLADRIETALTPTPENPNG